jgi:hypothetical protein
MSYERLNTCLLVYLIYLASLYVGEKSMNEFGNKLTLKKSKIWRYHL